VTTNAPGTGTMFDDIRKRRTASCRAHPKRNFVIAQLQKGMLIGRTYVSVLEALGIDQNYIVFMLDIYKRLEWGLTVTGEIF
jgi:hypothetical protein